MSPIVYRMNHILSRVVQHVPVGTNLGLFHLLWMLLSGRLLLSRGAVIPGLAALGLAEAGRPACLGGAGVWEVARGTVAGGLGTTRTGGTGLSRPPAWWVSSGRL